MQPAAFTKRPGSCWCLKSSTTLLASIWWGSIGRWTFAQDLDSGTPENLGPVVRGDVMAMHVDGFPQLSAQIV
jgi:hypothetical protein